MSRQDFQYEGLKWLHELELLNHPQAVNTIKFNIMVVSKRITEVELLIYRENKTMLVLLELSWLGRKFYKKEIFTEVEDALTVLLPSFKFRITDNPNIMKLAIDRVKKALAGGSREVPNSGTIIVPTTDGQLGNYSGEVKSADGPSVNIDPSSKEQSQPSQGLLVKSITDDFEEF